MADCEEITALLTSRKLAVLATQADGQPHASLMAFTPAEGIKRLIFATYRATRKYESLCRDGRAALLIGSGIEPFEHQRAGLVVTAHGRIADVPEHAYQSMLAAHINRHPEFEEFLMSPDCALLSMEVSAYQLVTSTNEVRWCNLESIFPVSET
ncbi:MAG: pyridoxamine 5'-phosphate oxidase family protein [Oceanococcus sp.]